MTCYRQPGTIEAALFNKIIQDKPGRFEDITGVGLDVIIKASNPNHPHNLSAVHVPNLDTALVAAGRAPVFIPLLSKMFERACEDHGVVPVVPQRGAMSGQIMDAMSNLGVMVDTWRAATCPNGEGGKSVTPRECDAMTAAIAEMRETLDAMERSIEAKRPGAIIRMTGQKRPAGTG